MIRQNIYLEKYKWNILVCYGVCSDDIEDVCEELALVGCEGEPLKKACDQCEMDIENSGLSYSNTKERRSVVLISKTTSFGELLNTYNHEMHHVVTHICLTDGIPLDEEEPCYMTGWLGQALLCALM